MTSRFGRTALVAGLAGLLLAAGGCNQIRDRQGYLADPVLVAAVQPGVDNRDSVTQTLGRPTFVGQFDQRDWYYVSRETRNLGFNMPRAVQQQVLHIRFDEAGNVAAVNKTGLEQIASISPTSKETPTLGRDKSFFEELFGNIGQVGSAGTGPGSSRTPDNPQ
jgi:outer membrane protein assembly factor BamE (lipoprotein component of BamABCDE complex)